MPEARTDAELVAAIAGGDRDALAALYDRYGARLLGLASRVLADAREAEDLLHDVFIETWRQADGYDASRGTVRAWLFTRMRSRALDRVRAGRLRRDAAREMGIDEPAPADDLAPDRDVLRHALVVLSPEQRQVLELAYFEGLSGAAIAARIGVPVGTVKSRTAAALARLRVLVPGGDQIGASP